MTDSADYGAPDEGVGEEGMAEAQPNRSFSVMDLPKMGNVATILDDKTLDDIGQRVWDEYKIDCESREDKVKEWDAAGDAWNLKRTKKSYPFENAANVKFPLLLTSAIQFSSRAMPALIHDGKVAKAKVIGGDPQGEKAAMADRVGEYLNYQIMEKNTVWMAQTEKSMLQAPIYGNAFKKVYRDPVRGNCSDLISCYQFVINSCYPDLEVAPRYTCQFDLYPYQIEERKRDGRFLDIKLSESVPSEVKQGPDKDKDYNPDDPSSPQCFLEQFRREDLDDDGYYEPYFVTIHETSKKVVRITAAFDAQDIYLTEDQSRIARIEKSPDGTYINYEFIPDPSGSPYGIGFGKLLQDIVEIINATANQILDAGNLQNAGGGWVGKEFRLKSGTLKVEPGLWRQTTYAGSDIRSAMVSFDHKGPAPVLFQMLGFMKEMAEKITNSTETLAGESTPNQPATTTLALIEQGSEGLHRHHGADAAGSDGRA
jgi:chaperonin GroES